VTDAAVRSMHAMLPCGECQPAAAIQCKAWCNLSGKLAACFRDESGDVELSLRPLAVHSHAVSGGLDIGAVEKRLGA